MQPVVGKDGYSFTVGVGKPFCRVEKGGTTAGKRTAFLCLMSKVPIGYDYIREEALAGRMGQKLMAIVAEGKRSRALFSPTAEDETIAASAEPTWKPEIEFFQQALGFRIGNYGMTKWSDFFTPRQLVALTTLSELVSEVRERITREAIAVGLSADACGLEAGDSGAKAYAQAVSIYLGIAVARYANSASTNCSWNPGEKKEDIRFTFSRQAISMTWDFAEGNPFSDSSGNFADNFEIWLYKTLLFLRVRCLMGHASQQNATSQSI